MLPLPMMSPDDVARDIGRRVRDRRLERNLTQQGLADRAGLSLASLKRFERTGKIAFVSLVRVAIVLDALGELERWFTAPEFRSIDEALARSRAPTRRRGRTP